MIIERNLYNTKIAHLRVVPAAPLFVVEAELTNKQNTNAQKQLRVASYRRSNMYNANLAILHSID